jgi:hypothetical protein
MADRIRGAIFSISFPAESGHTDFSNKTLIFTGTREDHVKLPASTKPATWSAIGGVIAGMALLSYGFGYMSPTAAERIARIRSDTAVIAVLAPACAVKFRELPDYAAKRAALEKASAYERGGIFPKDLVSLPGQSYANSDLVAACTEAILKMKTAAK